MGQIITTLNEAGINELFVKLFNALPDQPFSLSRQAASGPLQIQLSAVNLLRVPDLAANAIVIDLRGDTLTPPIRYANLPLRLLTQLQATINLGGWSRSVSMPVTTDVRVAGQARVSVERRPQAWVARLAFDAAETGISFAANRIAFVDAVRNAVASIDTQPWPGHQAPAAAVVNQAGDLAGQVFDMLQPQVSAAATDLARAITAQTRVLLGPEVPARYGAQLPGGGMVEMQITALAVAIAASQATLTATFA